jgi:hypothetical protein
MSQSQAPNHGFAKAEKVRLFDLVHHNIKVTKNSSLSSSGIFGFCQEQPLQLWWLFGGHQID